MSRDSAPTTSDSLELELLRAKLRNGWSVHCDRCRSALTVSSTAAVALECHLLRTAIELGWQVAKETALALGAVVAPDHAKDLCPECREILGRNGYRPNGVKP